MQSWVNDSFAEKGLVVKTNYEASPAGMEFASKEATVATQRPVLEVTYAPDTSRPDLFVHGVLYELRGTPLPPGDYDLAIRFNRSHSFWVDARAVNSTGRFGTTDLWSLAAHEFGYSYEAAHPERREDEPEGRTRQIMHDTLNAYDERRTPDSATSSMPVRAARRPA